jgi:hypothetical protein
MLPEILVNRAVYSVRESTPLSNIVCCVGRAFLFGV